MVATARHPSGVAGGAEGALRLIAATTGGVAVSTADLAPLERHLRSLPSGDVERTVRPARSLALVIVFATLLCAEWTIRRRRGRVEFGFRVQGSGFTVQRILGVSGTSIGHSALNRAVDAERRTPEP